MKTNKKIKKIIPYIVLHVIIFISTLAGICSKTAASKEFLSFEWLVLYGLLLLILAFYAIFWQQILKKIPLNTAYSNKAVTVIWGLIWGSLIFHEKITPGNIIGVLLIIAGIVLMVKGEEKTDAVKGESTESDKNE